MAFADEPLRVAIHRMAETGLTRLPVSIARCRPLLGLVSLGDMLKARVRHLEEERRRERVLPLPILVPFGRFAGWRRDASDKARQPSPSRKRQSERLRRCREAAAEPTATLHRCAGRSATDQ